LLLLLLLLRIRKVLRLHSHACHLHLLRGRWLLRLSGRTRFLAADLA
jgi:hypothetical protein